MAKKYCSSCGKPLKTGANFCAFCGTSINQQTEPAPARPTNTDLPQAKIIPQEHVSPVAQVTFMFSYIAKTAIVPFLMIIASFFQPLIGGLFLLGYLLVVGLIAHMAWSHYFFSVSETHFEKQHGIIHKKSVTIPFDQIQNVNVSRSLLDQMLGIARIDVQTAGNNKQAPREVIGGSFSIAEGHLVGVDINRAKEVHDTLMKKVANS